MTRRKNQASRKILDAKLEPDKSGDTKIISGYLRRSVVWLATGAGSCLRKLGWIIFQSLTALLTCYVTIPTFATRLDVSTLPPLYPKDIRTTYFELKNVGSFPTQEVYFTCVWNDVRFENNVKIQRARTGSGQIDVGVLEPNQAETTLCLDRHAIDVGEALYFR